MQISSKLIKSVGIDIGTTTTHLVFSEILLKIDPRSKTNKFEIVNRTLLYSSPIYMTPLIDEATIDTIRLEKLFNKIYSKAAINIDEIDTGAVVITGETARKDNAQAVVNLMAKNAGKFVSATAGPHFESIISAKGSGAIKISSSLKGIPVINIDVGGGTSNIALIKDGKILNTACINVGGRLITFEDKEDNNNQYKLLKTETAIIKVANELNLSLHKGTILSEDNIMKLAKKLAECLFEVLTKEKKISLLTQKLLLTESLDIETKSDIKIFFSGGVAEYIYKQEKNHYNDLGPHLAQAILEQLADYPHLILDEPIERIRATVIGAGQYTLQVSGSTTLVTADKNFPLRNLPVVIPYFTTRQLTENLVINAIQGALKRLDLIEGENPFVLAFHDPVTPVYKHIAIFTRGIEKALPKIVANSEKILILVFDTDIGNSVGNVLYRETNIKNQIISIDEISLNEGDFIDIGAPIIEKKVFPVIIKSLIFNK
ncbi:MAG: ethanolamine ammonia-lyase reactivating factor EutA [Candidatus Hodarchaeales archaeon]|jgi:ethanolamine utilization protein EutA